MLAETVGMQSPSISRDAVFALQNIMSNMPQAPGMATTHHFAGGMYCRRIEIPAGDTIVSKIHKTEHLFIGISGELAVAGQGDTYTLRAGDVVPSLVGTKRIVHALTDVVCLTIHKTDKTSTDGLEEELIEDDGLSLYDVNNQPNPGVFVALAEVK